MTSGAHNTSIASIYKMEQHAAGKEEEEYLQCLLSFQRNNAEI
jgi:hypothetical protein